MELLVIVLGVCVVLGAMIFQSKNRSPLAGGLLGLFGVVGLVVAALFPKRREPEWPPEWRDRPKREDWEDITL